MPAAGAIRRGHSPEWPGRATAASRRCTIPRWRIGHPGAMAAAVPAWPQAASGALQRFEALEPAPFVPQRLGLDLVEAPKPLQARLRVVAAACALPEAALVGAEAERSQQIALRAPDQLGARTRRTRQPLFEREPPRKTSRACRPPPRHGLMSDVLLRHAPIRSRDAALAPEFCPRQEKPSQKASLKKRRQETPPLKEGRRSADRRVQEPHRKAMRRASFLLSSWWEDRGRRDLMERARSPFGAPPRHPRFFLTSARLKAALPGTTGCKREDPLRHQCSEHLAVRHAPDGTMPKPPASAVYSRAHENRSRSALRSTLAKGVLRERDFG